jgi:nitrilase
MIRVPFLVQIIITNMNILACQIEIPPVAAKEAKSQHLQDTAQKISTHLAASENTPDLVVLPELSGIDYSRAAFNHLDELSEPLGGESFSIYSRLAASHRLFISYGIPRVESDKYYISQVVVGPDGEYVGHYDKLHIAHFGASMEKDYFHAGEKLLLFDIKGIKVAPIICYDFRFPELIKTLCILNGADLVLHAVAFYNDSSYSSWHSFAVTRALENQVYFLSLNRAGEHYGSSIFCPPWVDHNIKPTILSKEEQLVFVEVDFKAIQTSRQTYPLRQDARDDYGSLRLG